MDLRITIEDDNGDVLKKISIYQDGSDSEAVDDIAEWLGTKYCVENIPIHGLPEFPTYKYTGNPKFNREGEPGVAETYGDDLYDVQKHNESHPKTVWTILDVDGELIIAAGYHYVNRLQYFISNEEWESENEEYGW